jgi:hypothetical protein
MSPSTLPSITTVPCARMVPLMIVSDPMIVVASRSRLSMAVLLGAVNNA